LVPQDAVSSDGEKLGSRRAWWVHEKAWASYLIIEISCPRNWLSRIGRNTTCCPGIRPILDPRNVRETVGGSEGPPIRAPGACASRGST
jgi:hypothetical protein